MAKLTARDCDFLLQRIGDRIKREFKLEAALHGIQIDDATVGIEASKLKPESKTKMANRFKEIQEAVKSGKPHNSD